MKVFRDEIKLAFFGSTQNDEGEGTNLDEEGQQAQGDVEGDPEDDLDGEDDDDSEESRILKGWGTLHLTMTLIMLHCKIFLIEYDAWASLESVTKTWIFSKPAAIFKGITMSPQ